MGYEARLAYLKTDRVAITKGRTGRDNLRDFDRRVELEVKMYEQLKPVVGSPKRIFVGGCGYGKDVLAISRVFPEAETTAVSLGETPVERVRQELGQRLHFYEETILEHFCRVEWTGARYDLMMFMFVISGEFQQIDFYFGLDDLLAEGGFILNDDSGAWPIDGQEMFYRHLMAGIAHRVPHNSTIFFKLWQKNGRGVQSSYG